jgi:hypothetical protein
MMGKSGCEQVGCPYAGRKDGKPFCNYPGSVCIYHQPINKPLRWRTGPVPKNLSPGTEVFYKAFIDGIGEWCGVGYGIGEGMIEDRGSRGEDGILIEHGDYMWLPLSEILALVED